MIQKNKELVLQDIYERLFYGLHVRIYNHWTDSFEDEILTIDNISEILHNFPIEDIKPYLRPMSSMTEEEKKIIRSYGFELIPYDTGHTGFANIENCIDEVSFKFMEEFLNSHHFDYRGLIEKSLAIVAPDGMYK